MSLNIMNEYVGFSKKCMNKYIKIIMEKDFDQDTFDELASLYTEVRYYNQHEKKYNSLGNNIGYNLMNKTKELIKDVEPNEAKKIKATFSLFQYMLYFDHVMECKSVKDIIGQIAKFREENLELEDKGFSDKLFTEARDDLNKKKNYIESLEPKEFKVDYIKTNNNSVYQTSIYHKVKFPRIYSKYAIDKAYTSKEITEQKLYVLYPCVAGKILQDVLKGNFEKKYLVEYIDDLNSKPRKSKRLFTIIDDDIVREKLIIKINYKDFNKNKEPYYEKMREGYHFAIVLDEEFEINEQSTKLLEVFNYIIISKSLPVYEELKDLSNAIITK